MGRVSVPLWLIILSNQLLIVALVGHYPTNKLIGRKPLLKRLTALMTFHQKAITCGISLGFPKLFPT